VAPGLPDRVENPPGVDLQEGSFVEPLALFGIQYTVSLVAYGLIGFRYVAPRFIHEDRA